MKQIPNRISILAAALIFSGFTMTACQSEKQIAANNSTNIIKENAAVAGEKEKSSVAVSENKNKEDTKTEKTPERDADGNRKAVSAEEVTGTFRMNFDGEFKDSYNEILILALGDNKLKIALNLIYPTRYGDKKDEVTANAGQMIVEAPIKGDTAIYSSTKDGKCEITIKFVKAGEIEVTQEQEGAGCGFGLNVTAEGTYRKTSGAKPDFKSIE